MLTYRKKRNEKQKSLRGKGFTLVEAIVVMAILAILASASAAGLIRWQHNAQFRKANEYARTLFTAAQTYLTGAKAQGNLMDPTEFFSDEDLVPERVAGSKDYGRLYSLFWKPSYYKDMKAEYSQKIDPSDTPEEKKGKLFYQMFREYLYDKSVLDASICVEFDPVDGVVEAVLYSDRATSMSYNSGTNGAMEIAKPDREESARREKLLGLYNTEIKDRSPNTTEAPKIDTAELVNGDTLDLRFRLKSGLNIPDYIYEVEILDVEGRTAASFVVNNESSNKLKSSDESGVNEDEKYIETRVDVYEYSSGGQKIDYQIQDCQIRAYVEDRVVYVTLDAVDLNTAQILKTVGGEWLTDETDDKVKRRNFDHTYSVLRFGNLFATDKKDYDESLMGTISVRVKAKGARDGSWKMTNSESPLIQVPSSRLAVKSYNIANSRHFFNLRFMEAGFAENGYVEKVTYNLTDSFDWSGKGGILDSNKVFRSVKESEIESGNKVVLAAINPNSKRSGGDSIPPCADVFYKEPQNVLQLKNAASDLLTSCAFPAFSSLKENHTLDGKNKSVKGLYVIPEKDESNSNSFQDGLGLFLENQGTIENLKLENLNVIGRWEEKEGEATVEKAIDRVGGLCAVNQGTVDNVTVQSGLIVGKSCVGGIQAYAGVCILTPTPTPTPPAGSLEAPQSLSPDLYVAGSLPLVSIETMIREAELLEEGTSSKAVQTAAYEEKVQTDLQMSGGSTPSIAKGIVSNATNRASVEGYSYVGGIVGSVKKNESLETPFIEKCKNEGSISGATYGLEQKIQYIGGIAGYNEGGTIDSCNSAPALSLDLASLSQGELNELLDPLLKGEYVGGIVGYNKSGNVTGCFTTGGTLIGDKYVGGIIGYNAVSGEGGTVDGINGGVNKANVIGNKYVGGIVGANADMGSGGEPSSTYSDRIEVKNWKNRGMVTAREAYGGGITGYNAGKIENCDCSVDVSAIKGEVLLGYLKKYTGNEVTPAGNYIGGMAGYNNGYIYADSDHRTKKVVSVVAGNRYVGGMVGYNDCDGDVEGYDLSGGYISGNSFVGGFAGVNVSENMFVAYSDSGNGKTLHTVSKPNCIEGNYFVGGMVGGNLLLLEEDLTIGSNTDNFLGQIKSRDKGKGWFVGGVLGYNVNIQKAADNTSQSDSIKALADGMACAAEKAVEDAGVSKEQVDVGDDVEKVVNTASLIIAVDELTVDGDVDNNSDSTGGRYELNQIEGHVYVGGVVGYNQKDSHMTIESIVNKIPVIANGYIEKVDKTNDKYSHTEGNRYSYAGGIIGMAPQYTVINNCHNDGAGRVKTPDETTYHGALVEVNEGTIQNCTTTTVGEYAWSYVGGLAGVNGYSKSTDGKVVPGKIESCTVDSTVFGEGCIGGVAAENYGEISEIKFTANVTVSGNGENVGGIAGVNKAVKNGNNIVVQGKIRDVNMKNLKVTGNGTYVGGIAGTNEGVIVGGTKKDNSQSITPDGSSSVRGDSYVGGIIGRANGDVRSTAEDFESGSVVVIAQGFTNEGSVVAVNGDAGGIVGYTELDSYQIKNCSNSGSVEAQQAGNAGGIISTNMKQEKENGVPAAVFADGTGESDGANTSTPTSRTITSCTNTGEVKSGRGDVGGIAAHNDGTIERCNVKGNENKFLTVSARKNVGGVTSLNKGTIEETTLQYITVTNSNLSGSEMSIGGAVGINEGTLRGVSFTDGTVQSYSKNSNVGGLAGRNEKTGSIQGTSVENKVSNVKVCFAVDGINGNMGGIAGYNGGSITGYHYVNTQGHPGIEGKGGSAFGYGGISGINAGTVSGCSFQGEITAEGSQNAIVSLGGIAGVNEKNAQVQDCDIVGKEEGGTEILATNAYIGGAVGKNSGSVTGINRGLLTEDNGINGPVISEHDAQVLVKTEKGHIGGIIGLNEREGSLTYSSTGNNWRIQATDTATDNGTGGAIGYTTSDKALRNVQNLGSVIKEVGNSVGGLVGRWENSNGEDFVIQYGINRGYVKGKDRVGGLVGQVKYTGATLANCENYGTIKQTGSTTYTGGMIGHMYSVLDDSKFHFTSCKNFGLIEAPYALGAAGMISGCANNTTQNGKFYFYDCVNAGDITFGAGKKAGGISSLSAFQEAVYEKCRNYGRPADSVTSKSEFCGIATKSAGAAFKDCYGVSAERGSNGLLYDPIAPLDPFSDVEKCYYFGSEASEVTEIPNRVETISVVNQSNGDISGYVDKEDFLGNAYDGNGGTRWTFCKNNNTTVKSLKPKIIIKPESKSVNSLSIDWFWNGTTKRRYLYSLSCVNKDQKTVYNQGYDFLAGNESQGNVSGQHAVQTLDNLQLEGVKEIILEVTDVRDVNGATETSRQYLSIWEINLNVYSSAEDGDRLGTRLSITMNNSNGFSAIGADVEISGLPYDPNGEGLNWSSYQRYKKIDYLLRPKELVSGIPLDMPEGVEMELTFDSSQEETVGTLNVSWRKPTPPEGLTNGVDTEVVLRVYNGNGEPVTSDLSGKYESSFTSGDSSEGEIQSLELSIRKDYINQGYKATADVYHLPKESDSGSNPRYGRSLPYTWVPDFSLDVEESLPLPQFHLEIVEIESGHVTYDLVWDNAGEYEDGDTLTLGGITALTNRMQKTGEGAVQRLNNVTIGANPSATVSAQVVRKVEGKTVQSKKVAYQTQLLSGSYLEGDNKIALMTNSVFYGETPDTLYLESTLAGNCESFYRTDLMANDKDLGIEVAVASTVARVPTMDVVKNVPMVLENLPQDSNGNSLVFTKVRAYPWRSQNDVVYYAWVVAKDLTAEQVKESEYWDGSNTKMKPGYFVEKVNGNYQIIYTACQKQIQEKKFGLEKITAPEIYEYSYDSNRSEYTFTWETQSDAKYDVILNGYIQEGGEAVALYYGTMENTFSLTVPAENWRYPILELTVVRHGETNNKGELINFGAKATKRFCVKLPLTTITAPIIQLANGKNELQYNISWGGLPDNELEALWEYQVWAQKGEGKIWLGSETREEKDGWKWKNQIEVDFDNIPQINGADQTPKINGGDEVEIYVKAIAKGDSSYRDSADGLKVRFQVPTRMDTPDHDKMFLKWKDGEKPGTITRQEFEEEGFLFQVDGQEENNTCIFQAYLVGPQDEKTSYSEVPEGAQPLYKEPESMNGSSYLFTGIDSKYAGWHLLIRVRATSDNAISSLWSDYYSFKLPKVQVDTPELEEESKNVNRECCFWNDGEDKGDAQELSMSVNHTALKWEAVKHAETYEVELRKLHTGEGETDERAPYSFFIKKEDGVWKVIGDDLTSEGKWEETMGRQPVPGGDAGSYVYEFKHKYKEEDGSLLIEGYEEEMEAQSLEGDVLLNFSYKAALKLEVLEETSGKTEFRLILPDGEAKGYDFQRTQYVAVKAYPEDTQNYVNSQYCQWIRICLTGQEASAKMRIIDVQSTDYGQFWNETDGLDLEHGWIIQNLIWDRPVTSQSSGETKGLDPEEELKEDQKQNAAQDDLLAYEEVEDVPLEMIPAENHGFTSGEEMSHELEDVVDMIPETPDSLSDGGGGQTEEAVDDVGQ